MRKIVVIGGINIDFIAKSNNELIKEDSNVGKIEISIGGVAKNIASNLAMLHNVVNFITPLGEDIFKEKIINELKSLNIFPIFYNTKDQNSTYVAIHNNDGKMKLAVCDSSIMDNLTNDFILDNISLINAINPKYIVIDTNLNPIVLSTIFKTLSNKLICVDGVSTTKVKRILPHLNSIYLLKVNHIEAETLANKKSDDLKELASILISKGLKNIIITDGKNPLCIANSTSTKLIDVPRVDNIKNETGAGDALFSGVIDKLNDGNNLYDSVLFGMELAKETLKSEESNNNTIKKYSYIHKN